MLNTFIYHYIINIIIRYMSLSHIAGVRERSVVPSVITAAANHGIDWAVRSPRRVITVGVVVILAPLLCA